MPDEPIKCKVCQKEIKGVFDQEEEITVPRIAAQFGFNETEKKKDTGQNSPRKVLIYLTCQDFHGPFPYEIPLKERS